MKLFLEKYLLEMAKIGTTSDSYDIVVRTNDLRKIPHFHYVDHSTFGNEFHTCIRLDVPEYFLHEGKDDVLNSKQKKNLVSFLKELDPEEDDGRTNFDTLLREWNRNNSDVRIDYSQDMPDYSKL